MRIRPDPKPCFEHLAVALHTTIKANDLLPVKLRSRLAAAPDQHGKPLAALGAGLYSSRNLRWELIKKNFKLGVWFHAYFS